MADANRIDDDFDLDFFDQDPAAQDGGMQLSFQQPLVAEIQMEEEPYTGDFRQWIIIFQLFHQVPIDDLLEGFHRAHHQGQPVYAVERVYGEWIPGNINGLFEYEPAAELPMFAVFAQEDPSREYKRF